MTAVIKALLLSSLQSSSSVLVVRLVALVPAPLAPETNDNGLSEQVTKTEGACAAAQPLGALGRNRNKRRKPELQAQLEFYFRIWVQPHQFTCKAHVKESGLATCFPQKGRLYFFIP